jgi:hypothetical protein
MLQVSLIHCHNDRQLAGEIHAISDKIDCGKISKLLFGLLTGWRDL